MDRVYAVQRVVAQNPQHGIDIRMQAARRPDRGPCVLDALPCLAQHFAVGGEFRRRRADRGRPQDEPFAGRRDVPHDAGQAVAFGLVLDLAGHHHPVLLRRIHQRTTGQRETARQLRALAVDRVLRDLDDDRFALVHRRRRLAVAPAVVVKTQEAGLPGADIDKRRLHPLHDPLDASEVDIADDAGALGALDDQVDQDRLVHQGGAHLGRHHVDKKFLFHAGLLLGFSGWDFRDDGCGESTKPDPCKSEHVS